MTVVDYKAMVEWAPSGTAHSRMDDARMTSRR